MLGLTALLTILAIPTLINAKQVPFVDDTIRGAPFLGAINRTSIKEAAAVGGASTTTPGKLRVVENSGVCGTCI
jgi:hypothetical protein